MSTKDREETAELIDCAEFSAVQTLKNQLSSVDEKIANKAANDLIGIRLKAAPGAGGPILNLNFGQATAQMRAVKEASGKPIEKLEILPGGDT